MKKIAVIGANAPLLPFYKQAYAMGYRLIGIAWEEGAVCKKYCEKFYPISFVDKEAVLEVCRKEKVDGITSFSLESALPTLVYVAQNLGLVSNTEECVELTKSKFAMRKAFAENGIPVPGYHLIHSEADLYDKAIKFPAIIKPADGGGSQGINKCADIEDLKNAYNFAKDHSRSKTVIVEDFIDGREFSVEYLSYKGKHYFLQITDKVTSGAPHFIEMQHHQPANISEQQSKAIRDMVEKALTALKIENSPSHTEIKLNSHGELYIIEIGARLGGGHITSDLVRLSTGYDMVKGALELATGDFTAPNINESHFSGVYFYSKLAEYIGDVIREHKDDPEVVEYELKEGVLPEALSNADRMGYLIYQSDKGRINYVITPPTCANSISPCYKSMRVLNPFKLVA